jgi:phosphate transport system permease protein
MAGLGDDMTMATSTSEPTSPDLPREIDPGTAGVDRRFRRIATANGLAVLVLTGSIGILLGLSSIPTLSHYGFSFFTRSNFVPSQDLFGIASAILGTIVVAIIALTVAFPLAFAASLYIAEYAPARIRNFLILMVDLMAAVPSLIFGVWGFFALMPHALYVDRWIAEWFGWIPIFKVPTASATAVPLNATQFQQSPFIAGLVVAMMVIPLSTSIMRNVFSQAPPGEKEAALALGGTRWGMIRTVVLPFGRGGIIGGTMLGLGRALGETIAVLFILSQSYDFHVRVLENGGDTISYQIANSFGDATGAQRDALLCAGFVLFLMTLIVNTGAAVMVGRSRSGAGVDI